MTINGSKQVNINGTIFSFDQFVANPEYYMDLIRPLFRVSTITKRDNESNDEFLTKLFYLLYYKKGYAFNNGETVRSPRRARVIAEVQVDAGCQILNALGIDVIKHNPKISKVMFKNSGHTYHMKNADMETLAESIKKSIDFSRNKLDVSLGIELEFIGDRTKMNDFDQAMIQLVGDKRYENKGCYNKNDGKKWILGLDGSLDSREGYPSTGYELTSPILKFNKKDMDLLKDVISLIITKLNGHTNRTCGTHVHMSFDCGSATEELCNHFGRSYRYSEENFFDKLVPSNRRGNHSRWCHRAPCIPRIGCRNDRYYKLNFANVKKNSNKLHLEFRQLDGTLDFEKVYSWIKLQKMFVELTMDSWKDMQSSSTPDDEKIVLLNVNEVVTCGDLNPDELETVMKMSKLVA